MGRKRKFTEDEIRVILNEQATKSVKEIAQNHGVSVPTIYNVLRQQRAYGETTTESISPSIT
jgi:transposase